MKSHRLDAIWMFALALFVAGIFAEFAILLVLDRSVGDRLAATAAVLGGLIGAAGAAFAVYLTLIAQRADEAEKVEASLRAEVAEFARLTVAPLDMLTRLVIPEKQRMYVKDMPVLVDMPDPVVFKATADRLARLSYGPLLVTFHVRIAEAKQLAKMASLSSGFSFDGDIPVSLSREQAWTHAQAWYDICTIADTILRADERPTGQLIEAGFAKAVGSLDEAVSHARNVLSRAPAGSPSAPPGDRGPSGRP